MKKNTWKLLSLLLAVCVLLPALVACHGSGIKNAFVLPEEFDAARQYEITFWAKNDNNPAQQQIYRDAVASFEELYPNIKVHLRLSSDYGQIYKDVLTNIPTGTTPNVCITYPDHIATYQTGANMVVPLDELMADERYGFGGSELRYDGPTQEEMIEKYLAEGRINGRQYAIPFMRSTEACYINKTYVEALGYTLPESLTWDFIWEVSRAAMAKDEEGNYLLNGEKVMIPFIYKSTDNMMIQYLRQAGAEYSTEEGEILLFNDTAKELLLTVAEYAEERSFSTFKISSYPGNYINAGRCIFAIDSTAGATWMGTDSPNADIKEEDKVVFEMAVMGIPQVDPAQPAMISQGPSVCVFNKEDPQEVLASWLFAQYLLTNRVQIAYSQTEGYVPVTEKARADEAYTDYLARAGEDNDLYYDIKIQATRLLLDNTENTFVTPVFNGSTSLRNAAGELIESVATKVRRGNTVSAENMEEIYREVSSLYRLDQLKGSGEERELSKDLPPTAVILIVCLAAAWGAIGTYVAVCAILKKQKKKQK